MAGQPYVRSFFQITFWDVKWMYLYQAHFFISYFFLLVANLNYFWNKKFCVGPWPGLIDILCIFFIILTVFFWMFWGEKCSYNTKGFTIYTSPQDSLSSIRNIQSVFFFIVVVKKKQFKRSKKKKKKMFVLKWLFFSRNS